MLRQLMMLQSATDDTASVNEDATTTSSLHQVDVLDGNDTDADHQIL